MNDWIAEEIKRLEAEQQDFQKKIDWLRSYGEKIPEGFEGRFSHSMYFDFDNLTHVQVVTVFKAFGGDWEKSLSSGCSDRVDYVQQIGEVIVRCWQGEPPPNCKIVEVEQLVPAQPSKIVVVRKLVCKETIDASQSL